MEVRIYYEDTDAAGVVYHANYLKYFERARSEYLRERGVSVSELASQGFVFPVVRVEIDFKSPALHDDLLVIHTSPERVKGSSFTLRQQALRKVDGGLLADALITLVCVGPGLKARRIPSLVKGLLEAGLSKSQAEE